MELNVKSLAGLTITLVIASVLTVTILVPIVSESVKVSETFYNEGAFFMTANDEEYVIKYDLTNQQFVVNGESIPFSDLGASNWTVVSTDSFFLRINNWPSQNYAAYLFRGASFVSLSTDTEYKFVNGQCYWRAADTDDYTPILTYSSDSFRGIVGHPDEYVCSDGARVTVLQSDSIIAQSGTTAVINWYDRFNVSGTIEDVTVSSANAQIAVSDVSCNYAPLPGYNAYTFESVTFVATSSDQSVPATYNRVIVPYEVIAEKTAHVNESESALITLVPILILAGLVIGVVGSFIRNRD